MPLDLRRRCELVLELGAGGGPLPPGAGRHEIIAGEPTSRYATALIQPCSNSGPAFAAVAIAFDNDADILGAITAILFLQIVVGLLTATYAGRTNTAGHPSTTSV